MELRELKAKILEALISTLPVTVVVYIMSLTPLFEFSSVELITFTIAAVMLVLAIGGAVIGTAVFSLKSIGLGIIVGIILNLILPEKKTQD